MKRILIVAGTRPEIIKLAPVILLAKEQYADKISVVFCVSGQHQSMAQEALDVFRLVPDERLEIMKAGQTLNDISQAVFERLPSVIENVKPDALLVQGDTTTAAMSAVCAFHMRVPVGHVEAGLRSFNLEAPYPEELNRKVINSLARYNFSPTEKAKRNLLNEGVAEEKVFLTGNTIVDALNRIANSHPLNNVESVHRGLTEPYVLVTAHRRESFGEGIQHICRAIQESAKLFPGIRFVYPVHLNPAIHDTVHKILGNVSNVVLIPPIPYLQLLTLLKNCLFVLTDSGGIQEEAPSFGKYCIVMREVTERTESVDQGYSELVGMNSEKIVSAVKRAVDSRVKIDPGTNPYGDGNASERILNILTH